MPPEVDDGSIADDAGLLRRIRPDQIVDDQNLRARRPSSAAFKDPAMSVDAEPILHQHSLDWTFSLRGLSGYSLVRISAGAAREKTLAVVHKPEPDNPAHTEVIGKKTQSIANHLVAASTWIHLESQGRGQIPGE
jgi:hypothetical protein